MLPLCGLWPASDRLHLFTTVTARSHVMLGHFLVHYAAIGVRVTTNAHLLLHEDFASTPTLDAAKDVCEKHGVRDVVLQPGVNSTELEFVKLRRLNALIRRLPDDAWVIFADADEMFDFPCDMLAQLERPGTARRSQQHAVCAFMQDRVADDFSVPFVRPTPSLAEQFPRCAKLRGLSSRSPVQANILKIMLLRARIHGRAPHFINAHKIFVPPADAGGRTFVVGGTPQTNNHCIFLPQRFSHYSLTREALSLAVRKRDDGEYPVVYRQTTRLVTDCQLSDTGADAAPCMLSSRARAHAERTGGACVTNASAYRCDAGCADAWKWRPVASEISF
jgi:hypothetical protein